MRQLIVGSRKSKLALIQTKWVIAELKKAGIQNPIHIREIETKGDKNLSVSLPKLGGGGVFLKEIEKDLLDERIDFAVHSLKDIPVELPDGLEITSIPVREDPRDALLNRHGQGLMELPKGAVIGTSSLRRAAQLMRQRPDVQTKWIRGPIDSRIDQMVAGDFDAIVLAMAGLNRLEIGQNFIAECLPADTFVPAMGQGALAIENRETDEEVREMLMKINDEATEKAVIAERTFLSSFDEGEQAPIGGYAYVDDGVIYLHGMVIDTKGQKVVEHEASGENPKTLAQEVADVLIDRGALDIIAEVKQEMQ